LSVSRVKALLMVSSAQECPAFEADLTALASDCHFPIR